MNIFDAVHAAIYDRLLLNSITMYETMPVSPVYPVTLYAGCEIEEDTEEDQDNDLETATALIEVWSDSQSYADVNNMLVQYDTHLGEDAATLVVQDHELILHWRRRMLTRYEGAMKIGEYRLGLLLLKTN